MLKGRVLKKGLRRREREAGVAKGAQSAPFATPASFPFAAAELRRRRRLACFSTLSRGVLVSVGSDLDEKVEVVDAH